MIAVDTNVLVRLLVDDPSEKQQIKAAKSLLKIAKRVYIPQIVQVEVVWVLESAYKFDKRSVLKALEHLKVHNIFVLQHSMLFDEGLELFRNYNADFSDCLILADSRQKEFRLATFDRKLGKLQGAQQLDWGI